MRVAVAGIVAFALSGCATLVGNATAGLSRNLTAGILDQDDPDTIADGLPAYLLLLDGLIQGDPENAAQLMAGARLYGAYAGGFVAQPERRMRLSRRALDYARRAVCIEAKPLCAALDAPYDTFETAVRALPAKQLELAYVLGSAWVGLIEADAGSMDRIAELPRVEALMKHVVGADANHDRGTAQMYLGVLSCLRPESLGGTPALGKAAFEQALAASQGRNQMARVLYAQYYARLMFDQELHDRLLQEALQADPKAPGLTLMNVLAQRRARELLASGKDYF